MLNCGALLKLALVVLVMVAVAESGPGEKLATCCKKVNSEEITEPITGYMIQKPSAQCVRAVIFQTDKGIFCSKITAPWVRSKIIAFEKAKAQATAPSAVRSSTVSLLSIITSTTSAPSPSPPPPSSSTSEDIPAGETFSGSDEE